MKTILSIVVPTKNRYFYLKFLVRYFHSISSSEIELVLHDNSDLGANKDFVNFLDSINDPRVKYYYHEESVSQTENCDYAVSKALGEYVTMLGDDDIFSKYLIKYVEQWSRNEIDAILPTKGIYIWPDVKPRLYKDKLSGVFRTSNITGVINYIKPLALPDMVMKTGGTQILNLPRVYHGIVRKNILDQVYEESGSYFPGPSPDMANAIALCKYVKKYITIDIPLIVSGQGYLSAGGKGAIGEHFGEIAKIDQLPKDTSSNWTKGVPFYWSGNTIYAESALKSLKKMNMKEFISKFNYEYLYATCLTFDTNYKSHIKNAIEIQKKKQGLKIYMIYYYFIKIWSQRIYYHLKSNMLLISSWLSNREAILVKCSNTLEVTKYNDNYIKKIKIDNT